MSLILEKKNIETALLPLSFDFIKKKKLIDIQKYGKQR